MRKWLIIFICFLLLFCLFRCKQNVNTEEPKKADPREIEIIKLWMNEEYEEAIELTNELYKDENEKREEILSWVMESYERDKKVQQAINDLYPSQKLEIQSGHKLEIEGNYVYTIGRIKNVSDKHISYFEIRVDFLDDDEQVLNSDYTNDGLKLNPGDMREFKIITKWNSDYKKYRLSIGDVK